MIENEQKFNEAFLCPYCERRLSPQEIHMVHIKPRSKFPGDEFQYDNLIISCDAPDSCGKYKADEWNDTFINSVDEDPGPLFRYWTDGRIREDDIRVKITISIINRHNDALVSARRALFLRIQSYPSDFIDELDKYFSDFPTLICYYKAHYSQTDQD